MTVRRAVRWSAFAAGALLSLAPSAATAQSGISDVIMHGRAYGVELPASTIQWMRAQGPDAFEFDRAGVWKGRVARVSDRRAAFDAATRERPVRGATSVVTTQELQAAGALLDGTFRMPILLGLPNDRTAPHPVASYQDRMFGTGAGAYSLTAFYGEMSGGLFDFTGDVIGWGALPENSTFYYGADPDDIFGRTPDFLQATLAAVDGSVDFGLYDNDGTDGVPNSGDDDGYVDLAAFMYSAHGRECGGPGIWAHRFRMSGWGIPNYSTDDASAEGGTILVRDYIIQGGLDCDGTSLQQIGVVAHEAGHGFGLPDLYDTCTSGGGCLDGSDGQGIGEWGLMGSGNWNRPHSPAHMVAHSKAFLGWIDVVTIMRDTALTIQPVLNSRAAYRINIPNASNEYFLLENRQRLGSDAFLNGTGLLIWHVDSVRYAQREAANEVNADAAHKGLDLEEADGLNQLDGNSRGDAGDSWPGSSARTTFDAASSPNSDTYGAGASNVSIRDVVETAADDITLFIDIPDPVTFGDVDGDDAVTIADLDIVMSYTIGATGPDYSAISIGDVDDDGDVDALDAFIIHAYVDGKSTSGFRVGQQGFQ